MPLGIHPLRNDRTALAFALPFGSIQAPVLAAFSVAASNLGIGELRPAPGRLLIALTHTSASAETLKNEARTLGFVTEPTDPRLAISACAGKPACASGYFETRTLAGRIAAEQPDVVAQAGHIHVSGCAKGCAHPAPAPVTLVGGENGVGLVVNGTARQKPLAYTRPEVLKVSLKRLVRLIEEGRAAGEKAGCGLSDVAGDGLAAAFRQDV